jgi:hypothetical protein
MKLGRREFLRAGAVGIVSVNSPLWARADEATPQVLLTRGTNGEGDGEFDIPIAVAVNQRNEILVTDFRQGNTEAT